MDDREHKIVDYHTWCQKCKHQKLDETKEPCNECLSYPINLNSTKPIKFTSKEGYIYETQKRKWRF
jgi:hypothetical protein